MTRSPRAPAYDEPIQWSPDSVTVEQILAYCEREYARVKKNRYGKVRRAILARIHGNLCNVNHRAYPAEISYATVARDLTRHLDDTTPEGAVKKAGYLAALNSEWDALRSYFAKNFTKPALD